VAALLEATNRGLELTVEPIEVGISIDADRHLLAAAVANLLQNAFKFTREHGRVRLLSRATADRVLIDAVAWLPARSRLSFYPSTRAAPIAPDSGSGFPSAVPTSS